jgi:putative ABC transport system permease protein
MVMAFYLAFKEVWRNRGRFFLFSLVIALITTLVLFIAALSEGLATANKQFLVKLDAQLLVFQKNVDLSANTSRIALTKRNDIARLDGIEAVGPIGLSNVAIVLPGGKKDVNTSLIGVESGKPGEPPVLSGRNLLIDRGSEAIIDQNVVDKTGLQLGDRFQIKSIQGSKEEFYNLEVVGITDGRQYLFQPSIFVPYNTWDQIRPQAASGSQLMETVSNIIAVKIKPGYNQTEIANSIVTQVKDVDVTDIKTAYESIPGYSAQQSTLNTQRGFTLLIGILVIGGFFQIQMLQKIPLIGVMKAIGTSNMVVAGAVVLQIILVTTFGVILGTLATLGLAAGIPGNVPVVFDGNSVAVAILTLLSIGPIGGLVSVRLAISVEPLIALGLSA